MAAHIRTKRVYDAHDPADGTRVLADRLWPRGLTKEKAAVDIWAKTVSPSNELRRWYNHEPARWGEFQARYRDELNAPDAVAELDRLAEIARHGTLTLLTATRAELQNHLTVLEAELRRRVRR